MVWYRFVSEQIIRSFSPKIVRSTRRNPTLCASPWSSNGMCQEICFGWSIDDRWWLLSPSNVCMFFPNLFFSWKLTKKLALSIEVCKMMCMFDLLKLYQECWWCRQQHTIFILHPKLSSTKMFQPLLDPFEVSTLMRLLNDSFRTPVAFRSRSMVKKNVQSWD